MLGLVGLVLVYCEWDSKVVLQLLFQCGSTYNSKQIRPWEKPSMLQECYATNKQTIKSHLNVGKVSWCPCTKNSGTKQNWLLHIRQYHWQAWIIYIHMCSFNPNPNPTPTPHTHTQTHTQMHTDTCTNTHTCTETHTHMHTHTHTHTHTHKHTHTHMHTHTHTHTHTRTFNECQQFEMAITADCIYWKPSTEISLNIMNPSCPSSPPPPQRCPHFPHSGSQRCSKFSPLRQSEVFQIFPVKGNVPHSGSPVFPMFPTIAVKGNVPHTDSQRCSWYSWHRQSGVMRIFLVPHQEVWTSHYWWNAVVRDCSQYS